LSFDQHGGKRLQAAEVGTAEAESWRFQGEQAWRLHDNKTAGMPSPRDQAAQRPSDGIRFVHLITH
jgi:hypothetical protein